MLDARNDSPIQQFIQFMNGFTGDINEILFLAITFHPAPSFGPLTFCLKFKLIYLLRQFIVHFSVLIRTPRAANIYNKTIALKPNNSTLFN